MKILIFSVAYHPFVGGAEVAVKEITDRNPDIEFHLVTVNIDGTQKREEKIGNVHVHRIGSGFLTGYIGKLLFPFTGAWFALRLNSGHGSQKGLKFDRIWAIMANYAGFAALFYKYFQPKTPLILTLQEGDPISYIKRHVWFVYPWFIDIFRRANIVQTISNYLADFARSMGARAPIHVIPNGVDVSLFSREYPAHELEDLKRQLGKKTGDVYLVTSSRLVVKNGVADVIDALTMLPSHVKFLILGIGPLETFLKRKVGKLGLQDRVIFSGFVDNAELPKYLKISDIFIRPSLSEGMGISFIEAMAAGIPVIATPVGGIPDFLKDGQTGIFCQVKDPKSIADAVQKILTSPDLPQKIISNGKKLVTETYDWNLVAGDIRKNIFNS